MRSVALDLGNRIAMCEVSNGQVVARATVDSIEGLQRWLGSQTQPATVALEACREAWWVDRKLRGWGHEPLVVDTTRCRKLGIGAHGRKTDRLDAEVLARSLEAGLIPRAHVLSESRQKLRFQLGVRRALVETRAQYITLVRSLARAHGVRLPSASAPAFATVLRDAELGQELRALVEPMAAVLERLEPLVAVEDGKLEALCAREPVVLQLKTAPGIGTVVAAAFVSVVDDANRFRKAHQVESYLGLVPSEDTSGKRRLGSITKKGNGYARALLVQAAWSIMMRAKPDDPLRRWSLAVAEKRGGRVAAIALARRLVGVLWAMWRDGNVYEPSRVGIPMAAGIEREAQSALLRAQAIKRASKKRMASSSKCHAKN